MKRNYLWMVPVGLLLVGAGVWFWLGRSAELRERVLREAGPTGGPSLESALFFPTSSVPSEITVKLEPVSRGLTHPTDVVFLPLEVDAVATGTTRQQNIAVVLEQPGRVVWLIPGEGGPKPWFKVAVDDTFTEKGLLGLAFHPRFPENGRLFLNYTIHEGKKDVSIVSEWHVDDPKHPLARPAKFAHEVLRLEQPFVNHDGGCLRFGPDGMLYIGWGDGGAAGDPLNEGQTGTSWLGSMLRIDVDVRESDAGEPTKPYGVPRDNPFLGRKDVLPETFAIGVRNPWRYTFAPDGRLVVADVGQNTWEEIGFAMAGDNLGWKIMEGRACFSPSENCDQEGLRLPFHVYGREDGGSITGGEVVLAPGPLQNLYVFGDYLSGRLWALKLPADPEESTKAVSLGEWPIHPSTFGRDPEGHLYVADHMRGILYRIVPESRTGP